MIGATWLIILPKEVKALDLCSDDPLNFDIDLVPRLPRRKNNVIVEGLPAGQTYHFEVVQRTLGQDIQKEIVELTKTNGSYQGELKDQYSVQIDGDRKFFIRQNNTRICEGTYNLPPLRPCQNIVSPPSVTTAEKDTTHVYVEFQNIGERAYYSNPMIRAEGEFTTILFPEYKTDPDNDGTFYGTLLAGTVAWDAGTNNIALDDKFVQTGVCVASFYVGPVGIPTPTPSAPGVPFDPCAEDTTGKCEACLGPLENGIRKYSAEKAWTALGCLSTEPSEFVATFLSFAIKIGGGIAFLLMLWGGFQIMTSTGDPEKLNQGKSILTSAAVGLLFLIFSVLLLRIIGIDILQLPGWQE